jgi:hypothetical protein
MYGRSMGLSNSLIPAPALTLGWLIPRCVPSRRASDYSPLMDLSEFRSESDQNNSGGNPNIALRGNPVAGRIQGLQEWT